MGRSGSPVTSLFPHQHISTYQAACHGSGPTCLRRQRSRSARSHMCRGSVSLCILSEGVPERRRPRLALFQLPSVCAPNPRFSNHACTPLRACPCGFRERGETYPNIGSPSISAVFSDDQSARHLWRGTAAGKRRHWQITCNCPSCHCLTVGEHSCEQCYTQRPDAWGRPTCAGYFASEIVFGL